MDSQTAIVSPSQLIQYAEGLYDSVQKLRSEGRKMREVTKAARAVWQDEKYDAFHRQLEGCAENLERFNSLGLKYSEFLKEKAYLANRYLHRR